jgi:hypothetical protein
VLPIDHAKGLAMPRRARLYLPDLPYHVVQRGNNREACFIEPENYQFYLILWEELSRRAGAGSKWPPFWSSSATDSGKFWCGCFCEGKSGTKIRDKIRDRF